MEEQKERALHVQTELNDMFKKELIELHEAKQKDWAEQFATKTSWSSNRTNAPGGLFTFKSDELDVESLWQVQPDLKN